MAALLATIWAVGAISDARNLLYWIGRGECDAVHIQQKTRIPARIVGWVRIFCRDHSRHSKSTNRVSIQSLFLGTQKQANVKKNLRIFDQNPGRDLNAQTIPRIVLIHLDQPTLKVGT
jgi:hypothetical protein